MVGFDKHQPIPDVSVGAPLPPPIAQKVHAVVIEAQRNLPAMCTVEFSDEDFTVMDNPMFRPGMPLTVSAAAASEDPTQTSLGPVFDGEIVALEAAFTTEGGSRMILRGYDKSHRLHRTRQTRTFLMQPDSLIATQIAADYGLIPRVDPSGGPQEYLCQRNQTDWEFLCERAREIGFEVGVSMGALVFRRVGADPLAGLPQKLTRGDNLLSFRPRVTSAEQPMMTRVNGWNPQLKIPVPGIAVPPIPENTPMDPSLLPMAVAAQFGATEDIDTDHPFSLPPEAIAHATARRAHSATIAFEAEGICIGNPALRPGGKVLVDGAGLRFSGTYTLSTVRHTFDGDGYTTQFTISGPHDRSLLGLTLPGAATHANGSTGAADLTSAAVAKVTNTMDPFQLGRVKVELPWLGDSAESNWAQVVSVGAGSGKGLQVIPEVGDQVLVVFEHGDPRRPFVLGGLYSAQDLMPRPVGAVLGGKTLVRMFKTPAGHSLTFDETPGMQSISIDSALGSKVTITDAPTPSIQLSDKTGQNAITIDIATQTVTIQAAVNLELKANGLVSIEGKAGVDIKAIGPMTLQGKPMKLN